MRGDFLASVTKPTSSKQDAKCQGEYLFGLIASPDSFQIPCLCLRPLSIPSRQGLAGSIRLTQNSVENLTIKERRSGLRLLASV